MNFSFEDDEEYNANWRLVFAPEDISLDEDLIQQTPELAEDETPIPGTPVLPKGKGVLTLHAAVPSKDQDAIPHTTVRSYPIEFIPQTHRCPFACDVQFSYNSVPVSKVREHYEEHLRGFQCPKCWYRDGRARNFKRHLNSCRNHGSCRAQLVQPSEPLSCCFKETYKLLQRVNERENHEGLARIENRRRKVEELLKIALLLWGMPECSQ